MGATDKPIGYWLKHLDNLVEQQFDATLNDLGLTRRHWQVLNHLSEQGPSTRAALEKALEPFWQDTGDGFDDVINTNGLSERGWVQRDVDTAEIALTDSGRQAHARIATRVRDVRAGILEGLTREEYAQTVRVLSVMAANIEASLARSE